MFHGSDGFQSDCLGKESTAPIERLKVQLVFLARPYIDIFLKTCYTCTVLTRTGGATGCSDHTNLVSFIQ